MDPKWVPKVIPEASRNALQKQLRFFIVFEHLWASPGLLWPPFWLLCSLWSPFWLPLAPFGLPFHAFCHPLASFRLLWGCFGLPKLLIASGGEILARSCRDSAKNVPRICQQSTKNPPYEPQAKLPFKLQVLRSGFVRRMKLWDV